MDIVSDRRSGSRARKLFRVAFLLDGVEVTATVTDISRAGAFLHSRLLPKTGTHVDFAVKSVKLDIPVVMATGEVVRVVPQQTAPGEVRGFGIEWKGMRSPGGPSAVADLFYQICGEQLAPEIPQTQEPTSLEYRFDTNQFEVRDVTKPDFRVDQQALQESLDEDREGTHESPVEIFDVKLSADIFNREARLSGIVQKLGPSNLVVWTPSGLLPVSSMVTVRIEPPSSSWTRMPGIHILGRVVTSCEVDEGSESELKISMVDEKGVLGAFELLMDDARNGLLG